MDVDSMYGALGFLRNQSGGVTRSQEEAGSEHIESEAAKPGAQEEVGMHG